MASFLSKLFGGASNKEPGSPERGDPVTYEGLIIQAAPVPAEGQWRLAGVIIKEAEGGNLERSYLRADLFASREEAMEFGIRKGRQIIDEQGQRMFANGEPVGRV